MKLTFSKFSGFFFQFKTCPCSNCGKIFLDPTELKEHQSKCNNGIGNVDMVSPEVLDVNQKVHFDVTEDQSLFQNDAIILIS